MPQIHNLSTTGAIASPGALMKRLFENFMVSGYSQTLFYEGHVASLRHIYSQFDDDIKELETDIRAAIELMYSRYFSSVEVFVEAELNVDGVSIDIRIGISVIHNKVPYTLNEAVNTKSMLALYDTK